MSKTQQILEEKLEEQSEELEILRMKVEYYERGECWTADRLINEKEFSKKTIGYDKLPIPRLEMHVNPIGKFRKEPDWSQVEYIYGIIQKHYTNCIMDGDKHKLTFRPFGLTTSSGGNFEGEIKRKKVNLPFRDGVHIKADSKLFRMPAYLIYDGNIELLYCDFEGDQLETSEKMRRV